MADLNSVLAQLQLQHPEIFTEEDPFTSLNLQQSPLQSYNVEPDGKFDWDMSNVVNNLVSGFVEGFTTVPASEFTKARTNDPVNRIVNSIGSLMGFVGFIPGAGTLGKIGVTGLLKSVGLTKSAKLLSVLPKSFQVTSVPMGIANLVTKKLQQTGAYASLDAIKFLSKKSLGRDLLEGGVHLGIASAVGSAPIYDLTPQTFIDKRLEGFTQGAIFGAGNRAIGNVFSRGGKLDLAPLFTGKSTEEILKMTDRAEITKLLGQGNLVNKGVRALSSGLIFGMPSTLKGYPLELQVYDYLLNAYFGGREMSRGQREALNLSLPYKKAGRRDLLLRPEVTFKDRWDEISPEAKQELDIQANIELHGTVNEYTSSAYATVLGVQNKLAAIDADLAAGKITGEYARNMAKDAIIEDQVLRDPENPEQAVEKAKEIIYDTAVKKDELQRSTSNFLSLLKELESATPEKLNDEYYQFAKRSEAIFEGLSNGSLDTKYLEPFEKLGSEVSKQLGIEKKDFDSRTSILEKINKLALQHLSKDKSIYDFEKAVKGVFKLKELPKDIRLELIHSYEYLKQSKERPTYVVDSQNENRIRLQDQETKNGLKRGLSIEPSAFLDKPEFLDGTLGELKRYVDNTGEEIDIQQAVRQGLTTHAQLLEQAYAIDRGIIGGKKTDSNLLTGKFLVDEASTGDYLLDILKVPLVADSYKKGYADFVKQGGTNKLIYDRNFVNNVELIKRFNFPNALRQDATKYYRGQRLAPVIDDQGNLILTGINDPLYERAGLPSRGLSFSDDLKTAIDYGEGQYQVHKNILSETLGSDAELSDTVDKGYWVIEVDKSSHKDIFKDGREYKLLGDKIVIPKGKYRVENVTEENPNPNVNTTSTLQVLLSKYNDFITKASALNKRFQVFDDHALRVNQEVVSKLMGKDKMTFRILNANNKDGSSNLIQNEGDDFWINVPAKDDKGNSIIKRKKLEAHRDGGTWLSKKAYEAMAVSLGFDPKSTSMKGIGAYAGYDDLGGILFKHAFHKAPAELDAIMTKDGLDVIAYDTTVKQAGLREKTDWVFDGEKFNYKTDVKYEIPWDSFTVSTVDYNPTGYDKITIPQQVLKNIEDPVLRKAVIDKYITPALEGTPEENAKFKSYIDAINSGQDATKLESQIDYTKLSKANKIAILKLNKDSKLWQDIVINEVLKLKTPENEVLEELRNENDYWADSESTTMIKDFMLMQGSGRKMINSIIGQDLSGLHPDTMQFPGLKDYYASALKRWFFTEIVHPKSDYSWKAVAKPLDTVLQHKLGIKQGEFYYGEANKVLKAEITINGEKIKGQLGKLWDKYGAKDINTLYEDAGFIKSNKVLSENIEDFTSEIQKMQSDIFDNLENADLLYTHYQIKEVKIDDLDLSQKTAGRSGNASDYLKSDLKTVEDQKTPILINGRGEVVEGWHRIHSLKANRAKTIKAYVPITPQQEQQIKQRYSKEMSMRHPEAFRFLMERVPMDSRAGARAGMFKGFWGEGSGIHTHPEDDIFMGGADKDIDSYFVHHDMPKEIIDYYESHKDQWKRNIKTNYRVSLGKESEYKDTYYKGASLGATLKRFEVLNEEGKNIGSVVVETAKDKTITLHPELTTTGKGYGQELYQFIADKFDTKVIEWTQSGVAKTEAAKRLWNSLEKKGLTTLTEIDEGRYARSIKSQKVLIEAKQDPAFVNPDDQVDNRIFDPMSILKMNQVAYEGNALLGQLLATGNRLKVAHKEYAKQKFIATGYDKNDRLSWVAKVNPDIKDIEKFIYDSVNFSADAADGKTLYDAEHLRRVAYSKMFTDITKFTYTKNGKKLATKITPFSTYETKDGEVRYQFYPSQEPAYKDITKLDQLAKGIKYRDNKPVKMSFDELALELDKFQRSIQDTPYESVMGEVLNTMSKVDLNNFENANWLGKHYAKWLEKFDAMFSIPNSNMRKEAERYLGRYIINNVSQRQGALKKYHATLERIYPGDPERQKQAFDQFKSDSLRNDMLDYEAYFNVVKKGKELEDLLNKTTGYTNESALKEIKDIVRQAEKFRFHIRGIREAVRSGRPYRIKDKDGKLLPEPYTKQQLDADLMAYYRTLDTGGERLSQIRRGYFEHLIIGRAEPRTESLKSMVKEPLNYIYAMADERTPDGKKKFPGLREVNPKTFAKDIELNGGSPKDVKRALYLQRLYTDVKAINKRYFQSTNDTFFYNHPIVQDITIAEKAKIFHELTQATFQPVWSDAQTVDIAKIKNDTVIDTEARATGKEVISNDFSSNRNLWTKIFADMKDASINMPINDKELNDLGDRMFKMLDKNSHLRASLPDRYAAWTQQIQGVAKTLDTLTFPELKAFVEHMEEFGNIGKGLELKKRHWWFMNDWLDNLFAKYDDNNYITRSMYVQGSTEAFKATLKYPLSRMGKLNAISLAMTTQKDKYLSIDEDEFQNHPITKIADQLPVADWHLIDEYAIAFRERALGKEYEEPFKKALKAFESIKDRKYNISEDGVSKPKTATEIAVRLQELYTAHSKKIWQETVANDKAIERYLLPHMYFIEDGQVRSYKDLKNKKVDLSTGIMDIDRVMSLLAGRVLSQGDMPFLGIKGKDLIYHQWLIQNREFNGQKIEGMDSKYKWINLKIADRVKDLNRKLAFEMEVDTPVKDSNGTEYMVKQMNRPFKYLEFNGFDAGLESRFYEYFPHRDIPQIEREAAMKRELDKANASGDKQASIAIQLKYKLEYGKDLSDDGLATDDMLNGLENLVTEDTIAGRGVRRASNLQRRDLEQPLMGYNRSWKVFKDYKRTLTSEYWNGMSALVGHYNVDNFIRETKAGKNNVGIENLDPWINFMRTSIRTGLGYPAIFPQEWANDPKFKIKGNPYRVMTEDYWINKATVMDKWFGITPEMRVKYEAMDIANKRLHFVDPWRNVRQAAITRKLSALTNFEAKMSMMSLLFSPKTYLANIGTASINTGISAGWDYWKEAGNISYLQTINPKWTSMDAITVDIDKLGGIESFIKNEVPLSQKFKVANAQRFLERSLEVLRKDKNTKDITLREIARQEGLSQDFVDKSAYFMRSSERIARRRAWIAHYLKARNLFEASHMSYKWDDPLLIEMANRGVYATQFLYSNAARPQFARTALGKIFSRFQLFTYNSIKWRADLTKQAMAMGYSKNSPEMDRFARMASADVFVMALATLLPYSIFNNALPPPYNHLQGMAAWLFGDKEDKEKSFFGVLPYPANIIQPILPPSSRYITPIIGMLATGDTERFAQYHVWTWMPFGRFMNDTRKSLENPYLLPERSFGIPFNSFRDRFLGKEKQ